MWMVFGTFLTTSPFVDSFTKQALLVKWTFHEPPTPHGCPHGLCMPPRSVDSWKNLHMQLVVRTYLQELFLPFLFTFFSLSPFICLPTYFFYIHHYFLKNKKVHGKEHNNKNAIIGMMVIYTNIITMRLFNLIQNNSEYN